MDQYIKNIDLPSMSSQNEQFIIDFIHQNLERFNSWVNLKNFTNRVGFHLNQGYSSLPILDDDERNIFIKIFEETGIFFDYDDVIIVLQRSRNAVAPHTDPGRTSSLAYLIKGEADTNFYSMQNFVPNIKYTLDDLQHEHTVVIPEHSWYLFNHTAIHGVENFRNTERIQIALNLTVKFLDYEDAKNNWQKILIGSN